MPATRAQISDLCIYLALLLAVFLLYARVGRFAFVNFDDPGYISDNPHVRDGISAAGLRWALTSGEAANWFPLTRISEMLDCRLFGLRAGAHHLVNVAWHSLATLFLFAFLHRATAARWRSAFVAFLFALHPLHVESVAWVSERKDVLSAFFWFFTLWAYVRYAERPGTARRLLVLAGFSLGLMSKPMVVTLPVVLLLLDRWPLRRWPKSLALHGPVLKELPWPLLNEKIPLFLLAAASAVVTFFAQRAAGAVQTLAAAPLPGRIENALLSYTLYIRDLFWPAHLAVFYPYPGRLLMWQPALAAILLAAVSIAALRAWRSRPYLAVGWFWYVVTLLPVIGLVQVGEQARADRYMYLPMVGLLLILAWTPSAGPSAAALAVGACAAAACVAWVQIGYWRNSEALFRHAASVTTGNYLAHYQLGMALEETPGRLPEAIAEYRVALLIRPEYPAALNNLGVALSRDATHRSESTAAWRAAIRLQPDYAAARANLAQALAQAGRLSDAVQEYEAALRADPASAEAHHRLALLLADIPARLPDAILHYQAAARLKPDWAAPHNNLGSLLSAVPGRLPDAIAEYQAALRLEPGDAEVHKNLANALARSGRPLDAIPEYETAIRLRPTLAEAHNNLGLVLAAVDGRLPRAITEFEAALRLDPAYADAHHNLGVALLRVPGRGAEAIAHLEAALRLRPDPQLQRAVERLKAARRW